MSGENFTLWYNDKKEEMESMTENKIWKLIEFLEEALIIGCKWIYKSKRDLYNNIEQYKARFIVKNFSHKEGIDYLKKLFRIIMIFITHFDLKLHQIDIKIIFLNGDIEEV